MTGYNLITAGNPNLYKPAQVVAFPDTGEVSEYLNQMYKILKTQGGLALAAPQIGIPYQLIVMDVPEKAPNPRYDFDQDPHHKVFPLSFIINPSFAPIEEDGTNLGWESCLSLPGYRGKVERFNTINCCWQNQQGAYETHTLRGFNARVFQHEYDHLEGITYLQRIKDLTTFTYIGLRSKDYDNEKKSISNVRSW